MNIKPLGDHVLIEPIKAQEKTKSGILLPSVATEGSEQGKVVAVGPGKKNTAGKVVDMDLKVGDIVLFSKYGLHEINVDEKEYIIAQEKDILAVLEK
ncbi:MAG: co-chaperone GroES [Candidatus Paceibacterota bacterium]|jgi:chaperonin GroES